MAKRLTRVSAGAALVTGLSAAGIGVFGAAPAQADVGTTLNYTCEVTNEGLEMSFSDPWVVDLNVGVPQQVEPGAEIPAPTITADVTPGQDAQDRMRSLNIKTLEGTATTNYTFGGQDRTAELSIPETQVPAEGSVTTTATGTGQAETAPAQPTEVPITAGDFTADLTTDTGFVLNLACSAPAQNQVGTVTVGDTGGGDDGSEEPQVDDWFDEPGSIPVQDNVITIEGEANRAGTLTVVFLQAESDAEDAPKNQIGSVDLEMTEGQNSKTAQLPEGTTHVRLVSNDCLDAAGNDETILGSGCNVQYYAPWATPDSGGDDQTGGQDDGQTGGQDDGQTGGQDDGQTGGQDDGQTGGQDDGQTGGQDDGQTGGDDQTGGQDDGQADDPADDQGQTGGQDEADDQGGKPEVPDVVQTDGFTQAGAMKGQDGTNALALGGLLFAGAGAGALVVARRRRASQL